MIETKKDDLDLQENDFHELDIDSNVERLVDYRENTKITLLHRFIYNENDPNVLLAIFKKVTKKLKALRILPEELVYKVDLEQLRYVRSKYRVNK
jgi:hypothetical protein